MKGVQLIKKRILLLGILSFISLGAMGCSLEDVDEEQVEAVVMQIKDVVEQGVNDITGRHIFHTLVLMEDIPATCIQDGQKNGVWCVECRLVFQEPESYPGEHRWKYNGCNEVQTCKTCGERGEIFEHIPMTLLGKEATCAKEGLTEGQRCKQCHKILVEQEMIPTLPHTPEVRPAVAATCKENGLTEGEYCSVCQKLISGEEIVPALGHSFDILSSGNGLTEGGVCTACGWVVEAVAPERYHSKQGYLGLGQLENGKNMQTFYDRIAVKAEEFHLNGPAKLNATQYSDRMLVSKVKVDDLKLTQRQGLLVLEAFGLDHPLYYWYDYGARYSKNTDLLTQAEIHCYKECADAQQRRAWNVEIYGAIQELVLVDASPYEQAKYCYDNFFPHMIYAYEEDGKTPCKDTWAHTVLGYVLYGKGVCESYADVMQLTLNFAGVDCLRVNGFAPKDPANINHDTDGHAWVMAQMEDGNWYYFDPTFDDWDDMGWGYTNFCVNGTQPLNSSGKTFYEGHIVQTPEEECLGCQLYPIPEASEVICPQRLQDEDLARYNGF